MLYTVHVLFNLLYMYYDIFDLIRNGKSNMRQTIVGLDTRALTKKIRENGTILGKVIICVATWL